MEPNLILLTLASMLGASGLAMIFVGSLFTTLIAAGNKQYVSAVLSLLFFPYALAYCGQRGKDARFSFVILLGGIVAILVFLALLWWEMHRLSLDFFDVISSVKMQH